MGANIILNFISSSFGQECYLTLNNIDSIFTLTNSSTMDDPVCSSCEEVPGNAGSLSCGCAFCHDCFQRYVDGTADELNRSLRCCVCGSITLLTYESKRFVGGQSVSSLCPHFSKSSSTRKRFVSEIQI